MDSVKAILFDSGRTLNAPRTGHWFITPNFMSIIENSECSYTDEQINKAMEKAYEHINKILLVKSEEDEFSMFKEFYEIVLKEIRYPNINDEVIELLAKDNVYNDEKILFKIAIEELGVKPQEAIFVDDS